MYTKGYLKNVYLVSGRKYWCRSAICVWKQKWKNQKILYHVHRHQDRIIKKSIKIRNSKTTHVLPHEIQKRLNLKKNMEEKQKT